MKVVVATINTLRPCEASCRILEVFISVESFEEWLGNNYVVDRINFVDEFQECKIYDIHVKCSTQDKESIKYEGRAYGEFDKLRVYEYYE